MNNFFSYYVVFKNGSYTPVESLTAIDKLPHYDFIIKLKSYDKSSTRYSEFYFIDKDGNDLPLRIGDWEVIYIQPEDVYLRLKPGQKYRLNYKLFNHTSKTAFDFPRYVRGVEFLKQELFPKLAELSNSPELLNLTISNALSNIHTEIEEIKSILLTFTKGPLNID